MWRDGSVAVGSKVAELPAPAATERPKQAAPAVPAGRCPLGEAGADGMTPLERSLRGALEEARFDKVTDLARASGCTTSWRR